MSDCILFSTADWDAPYWTNKQHTAIHLSARNFRVLYVESIGLRKPNSSAKDIGRIWRRLKKSLMGAKRVEQSCWVLSPLVVPFKHDHPAVKKINQWLLSMQVKLFCWRHAFKPSLIWTYHPYIQAIVRQFNTSKVVYHCVDDLGAVPGVSADGFYREEQQFLKNCHRVFTTSQVLFERLKALHPAVSNYPNVVDYAFFAGAQNAKVADELQQIPEPRIAYVGALSDYKVDFSLIKTIAEAKPTWHWVLIGEEREGQGNEVVHALKHLKNVHFLGYQPYAELPRLLAGMNVATLPSLCNQYTNAMFPMKYFEYLAAGIPIVSTPLAFTKEHSNGLVVASHPEAFMRGIETQLARGRFSETESLALVGEHTWDARLTTMLNQVGVL